MKARTSDRLDRVGGRGRIEPDIICGHVTPGLSCYRHHRQGGSARRLHRTSTTAVRVRGSAPAKLHNVRAQEVVLDLHVNSKYYQPSILNYSDLCMAAPRIYLSTSLTLRIYPGGVSFLVFVCALLLLLILFFFFLAVITSKYYYTNSAGSLSLHDMRRLAFRVPGK